MGSPTLRWLFGDQLGPHFVSDHRGPVLMVESRAVFARRRFHRAKAHLVLSAMRHRARELGDKVEYVRTEGGYADVVAAQEAERVEVVHPTSFAALRLVRRIGGSRPLEVLPARGFATTQGEFAAWAESRGTSRLVMEDFYRGARRRHDVLMDGAEPAGGRWNFDHDNREPPPRGATRLDVPEPWWPTEDDVDAEVREDLDRWARDAHVEFVGRDGPRRFPATRRQALAALDHYVEQRLPLFGRYEDAVLEGDPWMAHSLVSAPLNLGLLEPLEVVDRAVAAHREGSAPLAAVEGFVRQIIGWRDYMWHLYWHLGDSYRRSNELRATQRLPRWFAELDGDATDARCLAHTLDQVAEHGWVHHIPRLMVLGSYAMQRGWSPTQVTDWFHRCFVDGYDWVMVPNVVGMSQHADGGVVATKPYTSGGAYLSTMTDHCGSCRFDPRTRVGEDACPFSAGYWWFLDRHREVLGQNPRMRRAVNGLDRLSDLAELREQEDRRGNRAPVHPQGSLD